MKKLLFISALATMGMAAHAQSSDFEYPIGTWVNCIPGDEGDKALSVWIEIERESKANENFNNSTGCGFITVTDNKTEKEKFNALLTYWGKGLNDDVGDGIYYFNVITNDGKTGTIGFRKKLSKAKNADGEEYIDVSFEMLSPKGVVTDQPFLKEKIFSFNTQGGRYADPTLDATNRKDFLDGLRNVEPDTHCPGFGDHKLYVSTHAKLVPGKAIYAKPKGTGAVNIRKFRDAKSEKIGELKPGTTLPVVDEYDGWCIVKVGENQYGCVSLSVVTLSNAPGATTTVSASDDVAKAETTCPLTGNWYCYLSNKGWGDCYVFLKSEKEVGLTSTMPKQQSNGNISMTDEEFVNERTYNLVFNRTIAANTYEFTVQFMVGKQLKQGKMQIKRNGDTIVMTGVDAWAKQQPFHGKTFEKSNPVIQ